MSFEIQDLIGLLKEMSSADSRAMAIAPRSNVGCIRGLCWDGCLLAAMNDVKLTLGGRESVLLLVVVEQEGVNHIPCRPRFVCGVGPLGLAEFRPRLHGDLS